MARYLGRISAVMLFALLGGFRSNFWIAILSVIPVSVTRGAGFPLARNNVPTATKLFRACLLPLNTACRGAGVCFNRISGPG